MSEDGLAEHPVHEMKINDLDQGFDQFKPYDAEEHDLEIPEDLPTNSRKRDFLC